MASPCPCVRTLCLPHRKLLQCTVLSKREVCSELVCSKSPRYDAKAQLVRDIDWNFACRSCTIFVENCLFIDADRGENSRTRQTYASYAPPPICPMGHHADRGENSRTRQPGFGRITSFRDLLHWFRIKFLYVAYRHNRLLRYKVVTVTLGHDLMFAVPWNVNTRLPKSDTVGEITRWRLAIDANSLRRRDQSQAFMITFVITP